MLSTTPLSRSDGKGALSGVILAGGRNRRMGGSPKALLSYHREKLIHRQIRVMRTICEEVILVTNEPRLYLPIVDRDVRILTDSYAGQGPLGGMHAALSLARCDNVWIIDCDMPFVSSRAARLMRNPSGGAASIRDSSSTSIRRKNTKTYCLWTNSRKKGSLHGRQWDGCQRQIP